MTEEEKLKSSIGCGSVILIGLIIVVILSLVGLVFPVDVLPYPDEILVFIFIISTVALLIAFFMWRRKVKDKQQEENDIADNLLRQRHEELGKIDDEAVKLSKKYEGEE